MAAKKKTTPQRGLVKCKVRITCPLQGVVRNCGDEVELTKQEYEKALAHGKVIKN